MLMEIAALSEVDNKMGQLARDLYVAHQEAGNGQSDFSGILQRQQEK
ncbi:MAG: hypothetical protein AB8C02_08655 [Halioglobus sp.]